jgi:hypothetical protein
VAAFVRSTLVTATAGPSETSPCWGGAHVGCRVELRSMPDTTIEGRVLELDLNLTAEEALGECHRLGLVVTGQRELAGRAGGSHWHLRIPGHAGTLELNECEDRVWVKVHPRRQGAWAVELAQELAELPRSA